MTDFKLPFLGEGIKSAKIVKVLVAVGQEIENETPVLEVETDKAAIEVPSSVAGKISTIHVKEGANIDVGATVLSVDGGATQAAQSAPEPVREEAKEPHPESAPQIREEPKKAEPPPPPPSPPPHEGLREVAPASPSVRRLAREIGVDIMKVPGSGPAGRISMEDVKAYARESGGAPPPVAGPIRAVIDFEKWGAIERKPMSSVREKTSEHMTEAWTIPHVTHFDKADVTDLEKLREHYAKKGKLTVTAIIIKVVASALKVFPQFNASIDLARREIIEKRYIHIGVAVDTDRGLLVPVIRDADRKNILELSNELATLAERARSKKISIDEMQGGTFTVTNLGGIGGTNFTPIINAPDVAILGAARSTVEPIWRDGKFEPRTMLPLALSYDHRVIDGADGARFLRWIVEALEQPFLLSLEG